MHAALRLTLAGFALVWFAGCATAPARLPPAESPAETTPQAPSHGGGYYLNDGPPDARGRDLAAIPDAVPREEPLARAANRPYHALGRLWVPTPHIQTYKARGIASWYGRRYQGQRVSDGEIYDPFAMTAAHPTLPIPSYVRVTNLENHRSVVVRVNDRGPFLHDRIIDLSYVAAWKLGMLKTGSAPVEVELLHPGDDPTPTTAAPAVPATTGVWLQLGVFSTADRAQALAERVRRDLGEEGSNVSVSDDGSRHRVRVGPYADRAAARAEVSHIETLTGIRPVLAR